MMTWWEAEQLAVYITELEEALNDWTLTNSEMRTEQKQAQRVYRKLEEAIAFLEEPEKRIFLIQLCSRIEDLQDKLTERLKRDVSPGISPRNLLF